MRRSRVLAVVLIALLLLVTPSASAHSTLIAAFPEPQSSISELEYVELEFESPLVDDGKAIIALATIREGQDLPIGATTFVSDFVLRAEVPDPPPPGDYVVRYQVTSEDGDLNDGGYSFTLLAGKGGAVTWMLLAIGIVALGVVGWLLRPRGDSGRSRTRRQAV